MLTTDGRVSAFSAALLSWFEFNGRVLPWRQSQNPFEILLAEKLLQQTSLREDIVRIYLELLRRYPTVHTLARANQENIRELLQPIGLHYRGTELVNLASVIVHDYSGTIPHDLHILLGLPGIGDYIARAVLCFAFGVQVPIVDTNVARVLFRVFGIADKFPANPARSKPLLSLAEQLLPIGSARNFNLALVDLGALICKVKKPLCQVCPLMELCSYAQAQAQKVIVHEP